MIFYNIIENIDSGHSEYTLAKNKRSSCKETDPRFVNIHDSAENLGETEWLTINGVYN